MFRGSKLGAKTIKNRSKSEAKMGKHLGIDFHKASWILGGKLGPKIEARSIKIGIEKTKEKRRALAAPGVPVHAKPGRSDPPT